MPRFVPNDFDAPAGFETADFRVRTLLISDVVKDYAAVMTSAQHLQGLFRPGGTWPQNLSFEQNLIDLGWHQKEFQTRRSFAYTVMSLDEAQCLGCLYINPTELPGYEAQAYCWIRASHAEALDASLYDALRAWLENRWPFKAVAYPGRALAWEDFIALAGGS
jgi:hypothetical protein